MLKQPAWADIEAVLASLVPRLCSLRRDRSAGRVIDVAGPDAILRLRGIGIPESGRPLAEVVGELLEAVYPHRALMDHPRFFAFIPGPASPLSWIGDLLTSALNPHAGSWLQSSGPSCIETQLISWLCGQIGLPPEAGGLFVSGGSIANLTGLIVARDRMLAEDQRPAAVAYVSEQTHSSLVRNLKIIGLLDGQIRRIGVDEGFRMDVRQLAGAVQRDRAAGLSPFAVVATAGTTNTGSIDPLHPIAGVCAEERLWMHVDGAHGASIALSPKHRPLLAGIERADSIAWDAHKWLFQTYGAGLTLVRNREHLFASFGTRPEYLRDARTPEDAVNYWDLGPELTRPARALALWLTLQVAGSRAFGEAIAHGIQLAEWVEDELRRVSFWEITSPAQLAIVTFRCAPPGFPDSALDELNAAISRRAVTEGFAAVLTTQLRGRTVLRICAIHPEATEADMRETVRRLDSYASDELRRGH